MFGKVALSEQSGVRGIPLVIYLTIYVGPTKTDVPVSIMV